MNTDSKKIRLQSSDGNVVEVDTEIIKLSNLIKSKMEDLPESDTIQLPNVNAAILNKVIQWCEYHKIYTPSLEDDENKDKRTEDEVRSWDAKFLKANQGDLYDLSLAANYMGIEGLLNLTTPIRQLPSELLVKVIDKLPRTQWTDLELIDHKFRDAVLLAWGSIREVNIERDFIYSKSEVVEDENENDSDEDERDRYSYNEMERERPPIESWYETLRLKDIAQKTEAILKKLSERSPFITSLCGLALIPGYPTWNTTAVQYLSGFKHLETIEFLKKYGRGQIVDGELYGSNSIPLIDVVEFLESTHSRATLNEICIEECEIPDDRIMAANFEQRLRAVFANDRNDPMRPLFKLGSFTMRMIGNYHQYHPVTFIAASDGSKLTKLSLGYSYVDPTALTTLLNGAPYLRHIDLAFIRSCGQFDNTPVCQGGRLQANKELLAALGSHQQLTSLEINQIWVKTENDCTCLRFVTEFKQMLQTIAPRLVNFVFKPHVLPAAFRMGAIRDIIQNHMPHLKSITLGTVCAENPEELRGIADGKELEEIEIAGFYHYYVSGDDTYKAILNEVLSTIIIKSPQLKRFSLHDHHPNQRVAGELCKLSDLIDLRIQAVKLTEENFVAFSQQGFAEKLEVLHLGSIKEGVESGLIELINKAPQLRELDVHGNVTDRLLECLPESCPKLETLHTKSHEITFSGIQMFVDRCPKLRRLGFNWWTGDGVHNVNVADLLKLDPYRKVDLNVL